MRFMSIFGSRNEPAQPATPAAPVPPAAAPNPDDAPVTRGEFRSLDESIRRMTEAFERTADRPVVIQQPTPTPAPIPPITDDEINAAFTEGRGASLVREQIRREVGAARQEVAAELAAQREYGSTMLASMADKAFLSTLTTEERDYFQKYEREIRGLVGTLEKPLQGSPDSWRACYDNIMGKHALEIANERAERALRQHTEDAARSTVAPLPGSSGRPRPTGDEGDDYVPSLRELAGDEFAGRLGDMNEDEFIRKINRGKPSNQRYKDWNDYVARGREIDARLSAIRSGEDDGGQGPLPSSLRP